MINKKYILVIDMILLVGSLLLIGGLVGYTQPRVIAPINDYVSTNGNILFEFKNADLILLDDNLEFSSPQEFRVEDNLVINLLPGVYYWKIIGVLESEVRQFTIESEVGLRLEKSNNKGEYRVVNSGNDRLDVDIYEGGRFTGSVVLDVSDSINVGVLEGNKFVGGKING
ncbi:MAG: hypothetical protein Q8P57_04090 [Candidatus Pacearchaeota archaeon]|nr:hypothetical protein [Candidatus Pacearchaeota archaeon]